jgi:O-acetyl-ADP-ribose deacetylase (regulator of RNase III)
MLTHVHGNLFNTDRRVIAHGVNCQGIFGAGVAGQVAKRYPEVKRAYERKDANDGWKPGDIQAVQADDGRLVVNMATQKTFGRTGVHVKYDAVRKCFEQVVALCEDLSLGQGGHPFLNGLAIPRVGAGLGGGDWDTIECIILDCIKDKDVEVEVFDLT